MKRIIMHIEILNEKTYGQYENFVKNNESSLFYHSIKYHQFLKSLLGCDNEYLLALEGEQIQGILPLMKMKGKFGVVYNSLPYYGSNGGIIGSNSQAIQQLSLSYRERTSSASVAAATIVANPLVNYDYSLLGHNAKDERIGQFTKIPVDDDEMFTLIEPSTRRNINKARKSGIYVEMDFDQIDFLETTHKENMAAIGGKAKNHQFFNLIDRCFKREEDYSLYVAKKDGVPIAALLLFFYQSTVEYFTPVIKEEFRNEQPLALILFEAMKDAAKKGFKRWNWGGTWLTQDGVYRFKKKWGAQDIYYQYYVTICNDAILDSSRQELEAEYPNFYVLPYNLFRE